MRRMRVPQPQPAAPRTNQCLVLHAEAATTFAHLLQALRRLVAAPRTPKAVRVSHDEGRACVPGDGGAAREALLQARTKSAKKRVNLGATSTMDGTAKQELVGVPACRLLYCH